MGKQNQMMGCSEVVEVTAQCVVANREVEGGGKGQGGWQGHTQQDGRRLGGGEQRGAEPFM